MGTQKPDRMIRGVPYPKYRAFSRLVRLGRTTWSALERAGLVEPPAKSDAIREFERLTKRSRRAAGKETPTTGND